MLVGRAVAQHVLLPRFGSQAGGPGMFSVCDPSEITTLLHAAGFEQVECDPLTSAVLVGGGGMLDESIDSCSGWACGRVLEVVALLEQHTIQRRLIRYRHDPSPCTDQPPGRDLQERST